MTNRLLVLCCFTLLACSSNSKKDSEGQGSGEPVRAIDAAASAAAKPSGWMSRLGDVDKLVYHFQDSSVPPQYHRSFTITVTPVEVAKVVDSYGDIISEQANAITEAQFRSLLDSLSSLGIEQKSAPANQAPGCTGGTSDSLTLFAKDEVLLKGRASSCGGDVSGTLRGDVKQLAQNAQALLVPNTDALESD